MKETSIPLSDKLFSEYIKSEPTTIFVNTNIVWELEEYKKKFIQNIYYPETSLNISELLNHINHESIEYSIPIFTVLFIVLGVLVLILLVIFYFKKYKHTAKRLNFELTDVRNVANLASNSMNVE